jgi:hypothetical protein
MESPSTVKDKVPSVGKSVASVEVKVSAA